MLMMFTIMFAVRDLEKTSLGLRMTSRIFLFWYILPEIRSPTLQYVKQKPNYFEFNVYGKGKVSDCPSIY